MRTSVLVALFFTWIPFVVHAGETNCERELLGRIIAEAPIDAMGEEFRDIFGAFLAEHEARPDNLEDLAIEIFELRLRLARKHGTFFARQMEPLDEAGHPLRNWKRRFAGERVEPRFSFGIEGHPRAHAIWKVLHAALDETTGFTGTISPELFGLMGPLVKTNDRRAWTWAYHYALGNRHYVFPTFHLSDGSFFMMHAHDLDVPDLRARARVLWRRSLDPEVSLRDRVDSLAEFEWVWFWTNPFGRSGALTGDALSILVQRAMSKAGSIVAMRTEYEFADLVALSRPLDEYKDLRLRKLLPNDQRNRTAVP